MKRHVSKYEYDECSKYLDKNIYVDNLIICGNDTNKLEELYLESNKRLDEGGYILRSWNSNAGILQEKFQRDEKGVSEPSEMKILGYDYATVQDKYSVASGMDSSSAVVSKRTILAKAASKFDPLGLTQPVLVRAKLILQKLWKLGFDWDQSISDELKEEWEGISRDLDGLS